MSIQVLVLVLSIATGSAQAPSAAEIDGVSPEQLKLYHALAEKGDVEAQKFLGYLYEKGIGGVSQNLETALLLYRQAAAAGHPEAQFGLARLYSTGRGVEQDYTTAAKWLRLAAEQGDRDATRSLGYQYSEGLGVGVDYALAHEWYQKAAAGGDGLAMVLIGIQYRTGEGVVADAETAVAWYRRAMEAGEPLGALNLGRAYVRGSGVPLDVPRGISLIRGAAEKGHPESAHVLGGAFRDGDRVEKNDIEALMWLIVAADPDESPDPAGYQAVRDALSAAMDPARRRLAEERAKAILAPLRRKK